MPPESFAATIWPRPLRHRPYVWHRQLAGVPSVLRHRPVRAPVETALTAGRHIPLAQFPTRLGPYILVVLFFAFIPARRVTADPPFFMGLGDLPGGQYGSGANAVSADGSTVVGWSFSGEWEEAFRWTRTTGMVGLGDLPGGMFESYALGVSGDGSVVVGHGETGTVGSQAFRWTAAQGMIGLGNLTPFTWGSDGTAASGDGSVIVGAGSIPGGLEAFRWTETSGMVGLGDLPGGPLTSWSAATGISADGSVIVGYGSPASGYRALRWTQSNGMEEIGILPGGAWGSTARAVSANGLFVVGQSDSASGFQAFIWSQRSGMHGLGVLPGGDASIALAVSDNSTVVGWGYTTTGYEAFIWDSGRGMRSIHDAFSNEFGLNVSGWSLIEARGISADGLVIAGFGINPQNRGEAWIAHLPATVHARLDIRPGDCPNTFNTCSHGYLPVALLGAADFDVSQVNRASLRLRGADGVGQFVAPHEGPPGPHSSLQDLGRPVDVPACGCTTSPPDGIADLLLHFSCAELTEALQLQPSDRGSLAEFVLTGTLLDGQPFRASDCIQLVGPHK